MLVQNLSSPPFMASKEEQHHLGGWRSTAPQTPSSVLHVITFGLSKFFLSININEHIQARTFYRNFCMSQRVSLFEVQYFPTQFTLKRSERSFAESWILSTKEIIEVGKKTFSCLMSDTAFPRQQVAPNKVFKRRLLIYNRFVHGLIYGFWRRSVCKIIWDYQMDFEKCNKIINYLDYPNGGRIWSVYCLANSWQHDIAWHMLPILAQAKAH